MAVIVAPKQCAVCKETFREGEEAVLVARCALTNKNAYGTYFQKKLHRRVNFQANWKRVVLHPGCAPGAVTDLIAEKS